MEGSNEITVYLYGMIYSWTASDFASIHARAMNQGIERIHLRINSYGGNVFAGNAMYNLLKSSKIKITTYNDGIAASMASVLLLCGDEIKMAESALVMIHNPRGDAYGEADDHRKSAEVLDTLTDIMAKIYARRTKEEIDQIKAEMKKESWYNSSDALKKGIIDEVYDSEIPAMDNEPEMDFSPKAAYLHFAAQLAPPSLDSNSQKLNTSEMENSKLAISIGLPHDASETEIQEKIAEINAKAASVEDLKAQVDKQKQAQVKMLIDGAITDGKITEAQRQLYTGNAMKDFETTEQMLAGMSAVVKPNDLISKKPKTPQASGDKSFKDLSKDELESLRAEDWEAYQKLFTAEFGYKPAKTKQIELSA